MPWPGKILKLIDYLFEEIDEPELIERIFNNGQAYAKICKLLGYEVCLPLNNAA